MPSIKPARRNTLTDAEQALWSYGMDVVSGIADYLRAREEKGVVRRTLGEAAIAAISGAMEHIRTIDPDIKGTWGAYDVEWIREMWLNGLRSNLEEGKRPEESLL